MKELRPFARAYVEDHHREKVVVFRRNLASALAVRKPSDMVYWMYMQAIRDAFTDRLHNIDKELGIAHELKADFPQELEILSHHLAKTLPGGAYPAYKRAKKMVADQMAKRLAYFEKKLKPGEKRILHFQDLPGILTVSWGVRKDKQGKTVMTMERVVGASIQRLRIEAWLEKGKLKTNLQMGHRHL